MKKILALFILLAIFKTTIAQTNDTAKYNPKTYGYGWVYNRIKLDSGIIIPRIGDTTSKTKGQIRILGNNFCWVGNDGKWYVAGSGGNTYTAGYGLNLTSFAFSVDTNLITTKAWLYKVADSLAALGGTNFANTDLRQTADRHYSGVDYNLLMDSISYFNIYPKFFYAVEVNTPALESVSGNNRVKQMIASDGDGVQIVGQDLTTTNSSGLYINDAANTISMSVDSTGGTANEFQISKWGFDFQSTTRPLIIPRLTKVQRDAITALTTGGLVWLSDSSYFSVYNGSAWVMLGGSSTTPGIDDVLAQAQTLTANRSINAGVYKFSVSGSTGDGTANLSVNNADGNGVLLKTLPTGVGASDSMYIKLSNTDKTIYLHNQSNVEDIRNELMITQAGSFLSSYNIAGTIGFELGLNIGGNAYFYDGRVSPAGLEYNADYSTTYTDRSLVDKAYVLANAGVPYTGATGNLDLGTNSYLGASYSAFNTSDHTTNYERGRLYYNSNVLTLASEAGGTGVVRNMRIDAGTGSITFNAPFAYNFLNSAALTTFSGTAQALSFTSNATTGLGLQFLNTGAEITNVINFTNRAGGTTINGSNILLQAQSASSGGTNLDGGDIQIKSGTSTGTAQSKIQFSTPDISGSGTTDNAPVLRAEINKDGLYVKTITDGTAGTDSLLVESAGTIKKVSPTYYSTGGSGLTVLADATNADFTMSVNAIKYLPAATLSTNRTITIPTGTNGDLMEIYNNEAGFNWNLTGGAIYLSDGVTTVTTLLANTNYIIRKVSGKWRISN